MEHQTWVLRNFLTQLERQEAVDKEATNGIAGEFAVSQVFLLFEHCCGLYVDEASAWQTHFSCGFYHHIIRDKCQNL